MVTENKTNDYSKRSRAHITYKLPDGTKVPGVTTVLGVLNKPALVIWANRLGLQGIDSSKYRDEMADIGTLAHKMILDYFKGEKTDTSEYSKSQIDLAENCLLSFWEWEKGHKIEVIMAEAQLISQEHGYGGTIDCFCKLDGQPTLLDFKTGKAIYPEFFYQLAAYEQLLAEAGHLIEVTRILRIGRDADEGFEERSVGKLDKQFEIFTHCLAIYNLKKEVK
uniref:PD-(D/E)XK nuclease superfamily protein n=1 Tax=viral metagenome TaxID=1070528 RepID=A0A6M3J2Q8_9ZZZZ